MKAIKCIAKLLVIVGALNWGLVGFFQYDLVAEIFGGVSSSGARVVFGLVGLAGLYCLAGFCCRKSCGCNGCGSGCNCCDKKNR